MDILRTMRLFTEVATSGTLTAGSKALGLTPSTASRTISDLEERLGEPLLVRTTRNVTMTEAGQRYLAECQRIIGFVDDLRRSSDKDADKVRGTLRIAASTAVLKHFLQPVLAEFLDQCPEVSLSIDVSDDHVDLTENKYDLAVRIGVLKSSSLIAQKLADTRTLLVVAPSYFERNGAPETLELVPDFDCLVDTVPRFGNRWPVIPGRKIESRAMIQDGETIRSLAVAGQGIAFLPDFVVGDDIREGRLIELFSDASNQRPVGLYAVYLSRNHLSPAARAFSSAAQEKLKKRTS
ncbi:MAG: LysR family transcriptional regulator [Pseudomonadota bacterium]